MTLENSASAHDFGSYLDQCGVDLLGRDDCIVALHVTFIRPEVIVWQGDSLCHDISSGKSQFSPTAHQNCIIPLDTFEKWPRKRGVETLRCIWRCRSAFAIDTQWGISTENQPHTVDCPPM